MPAHDHFIIFCQDEAITPVLDHSTNLLKTKGFEPTMPPELKVKLTMVLKHPDRELVKETPETVRGD